MSSPLLRLLAAGAALLAVAVAAPAANGRIARKASEAPVNWRNCTSASGCTANRYLAVIAFVDHKATAPAAKAKAELLLTRSTSASARPSSTSPIAASATGTSSGGCAG